MTDDPFQQLLDEGWTRVWWNGGGLILSPTRLRLTATNTHVTLNPQDFLDYPNHALHAQLPAVPLDAAIAYALALDKHRSIEAGRALHPSTVDARG